MTIIDMHPLPAENEEQYLWRLGTAKDSGLLDASWDEIGEAMNRYWRIDKDEYKRESTYRKKYQNAKAFLGSVLTIKEYDACFDANDYSMNVADLIKERQRLRDERTKYMQTLRHDARVEEKLDEMEELIRAQAKERYSFGELDEAVERKGNQILLLLSDWHIGEDTDGEFGTFNTEIAKSRLEYLLNRVIEIGDSHHCEVVNVAVLGDMISGLIHNALRIKSNENVMEQVMKASSLLSDFVAKLCESFREVWFVSVAGNHSRLDPNKDNALKDERLDDLISWYVIQSMKDAKNFHPLKNFDNTVAEMEICGRMFYFTHGDNDRMNQQGISKLAFMMGDIPYAVCSGHLHKFEMTDVNGVKAVRNGSLCGGGGDYTISKRLCGKASQTAMVCTWTDGIEAVYPVELE